MFPEKEIGFQKRRNGNGNVCGNNKEGTINSIESAKIKSRLSEYFKITHPQRRKKGKT